MSKFHNLSYLERYSFLRNLAEEKGFPILLIEECTDYSSFSEDEYDFNAIPSYGGAYIIDTKKLPNGDEVEPSFDTSRLDYVGHIIERALEGSFETSTSRKYSFGDTDDWWDGLKPETSDEPRKVHEIAVYVGR